mmetsp:Transcript_41355/g.95803  ORF Transcript_41355/g.95803 Transcript_41355/m.95803 type:complete len:477 (+) Transcript_41355:45-1475(+)
MRPLLVALLLVAGAIGEDPDPDVGRFGYDCEIGYHRWRTHWNKDKQQWCCEYVHRGCMDTAATYDCNEGKRKWVTGWSDDKKDWCCHHHKVGCPWNCIGNEDEWSQQHREFCCRTHPPTGCTLELHKPEPEEEEVLHAVHHHHFDCGDQRENEWTGEKKTWCCKHDHRGCPYDCDIGGAEWKTRWSTNKKDYCCKHRAPLGCPQSEDYNCSAGIGQWRKGWSDSKKEWCCEHQGRGCEEEYDCFTGTTNLELAWSIEKKKWCCKHHSPNGCEVDPFNCLGGIGNWRELWSDEKKQWCCVHEPPMGCETVADAFDCIESERHGWSRAEQRWCCRHGRTTLGCEMRHDHYCSVDFKSRKWSHHRICYCCKHHGIACPPVYYPPNVPENAVICSIMSEVKGLFETSGDQQLLITQVPKAQVWHGMLVAVPGAAVLLLLPLVGWVVLRRRGRKAYFARELDDHRDALAATGVDKDLAECS